MVWRPTTQWVPHFELDRDSPLAEGLLVACLGYSMNYFKDTASHHVYDSSPYNNTFTLAKSSGSYISSRELSGVIFRPLLWGVGDHYSTRLEIDNSDTSLSFAPNKPMSAAAWVYPEDFSTSFGIIGKYWDIPSGAGFKGEWTFGASVTNGYLTLQFLDDSSTNRIRSIANSGLSTNTWQHCAGTYDGSGSHTGINVYIDGELVPQTRSEEDPYTAMTYYDINATIGVYLWNNATYGAPIDGGLADVCLWDRELSQEEIQLLADKTIFPLIRPIGNPDKTTVLLPFTQPLWVGGG